MGPGHAQPLPSGEIAGRDQGDWRQKKKSSGRSGESDEVAAPAPPESPGFTHRTDEPPLLRDDDGVTGAQATTRVRARQNSAGARRRRIALQPTTAIPDLEEGERSGGDAFGAAEAHR